MFTYVDNVAEDFHVLNLPQICILLEQKLSIGT